MTISKKAEKMAKEGSYDAEVYQAYMDNVGEEYTELEDVEEAYQGEYNSDEDFVEQLLEDIGVIPDDLPGYVHIDWEATAREVMYDYFESEGHYFRNL